MSVGPIGVSSSSASTSLASSSQSIAFNPIITLASPESSVSQRSEADQSSRFDQTARAEAKAETALPSMLGGTGGASGFAPLAGLASNLFNSPADAYRAGDLPAAGGRVVDGQIVAGVSPAVLLAGAGALGLVLYLKKKRAA